MDAFDPEKFVFPSDARAARQPSKPQPQPRPQPQPAAPPQAEPSAARAAPAQSSSFDADAFEFPSDIAQKPNYQTMPWSKAAATGVSNFVPSATKAAGEMIESFYPENIPETAMGLGNVAYGAVSKGLGALGVKQDPKEKEIAEGPLNALLKHYGDKYADAAAVKKVMAEDPASLLADVSSVLTMTPKGLAKVPGIGGVASTARAVGELGTPLIGPAKAIGAAASSVSPAVNAALSGLSGVSLKSLQEAAKAGVTSDRTFWQAMSGEIPAHQLVNDIGSAISQVAKERAEKYKAGMSTLSQTRMLPFQPIEKALDKIKSMAFSGPAMGVKNEVAAQAYADMVAKINEWKANAAIHPYYQTVHGFDDLKQALGAIADKFRDKSEYSSLSAVRGAVKNEISKVDPQYADIMESYQGMSREIEELNKELLTKRGSDGSVIRKLFRAQNDKHKQALLEDLAKRDPSLPAKIAGLEVAHAHGHVGENIGFGALLNLLINEKGHLGPVALAAGAAALGSPATAARTAAGVKAATAPFSFAGRAASAASPIVGSVQLLDDARQNPARRPGRATGGAVGITADRLIAMAKASRRKIQGRSKAILAQPDEHVVSALKAVNKQMQGQ